LSEANVAFKLILDSLQRWDLY